MLVHALIASVRTRPEPAVLAHLDRFDEVFAYFIGGGFGIAVFAENDFAEFGCVALCQKLLVPIEKISSSNVARAASRLR